MIFYANKSKMKRIYKSIRKKYKRWKYGRFIVLFFGLLTVGIPAYFFFTMSRYVLNGTLDGLIACFLTTMAVFMFPFIALMLSYGVAMCGGRDIILARNNETIEVTEDKIIISFSPASRVVIQANHVIDEIYFYDIKTLEYEPDFFRTKIVANYTHNEYMSADDSWKTVSNYCSNANILIYDYFDQIDQLKEVLFSKRDEAMRRGYETLDGGERSIAELVAE